MTRVRLVVTGDVEEEALGSALATLFPTLEFSTVKKDAGNSNRLSPPSSPPRRDFLRFVDEMLASGDAERTPGGKPFDYVLVVDDLELDNSDQPDVAIDHLRSALQSRLKDLSGDVGVSPKGKNKGWHYLGNDDGRRRYLRDRCSYHLLSPMVEALFFGELRDGVWEALRRAKAVRDPVFDPVRTDIEQFIIMNDPDFSAFSGTATWTRGKAADPSWRVRHPKHYLTFLCDPPGTSRKPYKEKDGGKLALKELDWPSVVAPSGHACFVRAMLVDLSEMANVPTPKWLTDGTQHELTRRKDGGVLRNIANASQ